MPEGWTRTPKPVSLSSQAIQGFSAGCRASTVRLVRVSLTLATRFRDVVVTLPRRVGAKPAPDQPGDLHPRHNSRGKGSFYGEFAFAQAAKYMGQTVVLVRWHSRGGEAERFSFLPCSWVPVSCSRAAVMTTPPPRRLRLRRRRQRQLRNAGARAGTRARARAGTRGDTFRGDVHDSGRRNPDGRG